MYFSRRGGKWCCTRLVLQHPIFPSAELSRSDVLHKVRSCSTERSYGAEGYGTRPDVRYHLNIRPCSTSLELLYGRSLAVVAALYRICTYGAATQDKQRTFRSSRPRKISRGAASFH